MEGAGEKLLEDNNESESESHGDSWTAVQSVGHELRNIGDELCRLHSLRHRSYHHHHQQQQQRVAQQQRHTDVTVVRNLPTLVYIRTNVSNSQCVEFLHTKLNRDAYLSRLKCFVHTRRVFFFIPRAKDELPHSSPLRPYPLPIFLKTFFNVFFKFFCHVFNGFKTFIYF